MDKGNISNLSLPTTYDLIKKMNIDPESEEGQHFLFKFNRDAANKLLNNLAPYYARIDVLDPLYSKASHLITKIDRFLEEETKYLTQSKKLVLNKHITKHEMNRLYILPLQNKMDNFEAQRNNLGNKMRAVTRIFPDESDKQEHNDKINGFCTLFLDSHTTLDDIMYEYRTISKNLP